MDDIPSVLDPDELMDLEEPETYDLDDDDDDIPDDPSTSPFQHFSSGPASNATSTASSPVANEDFPTPFNLSGKPSMIKRGRGRPRREGGKPTSRRGGGNGFPRVRRSRPAGFSRCRGSRSVRQPDRMDFEFPYISPTSMDDMALPDSDAFFFPEREKAFPVFDELPYGPEAWPGKVCAFCNLGERSQLGQGDMLRLSCPDGFTPQRSASECPTPPQQVPERELGDKSPRAPVTCRRNKNFSRSRSFLSSNEHVDELTIIGHVEEPSVNILYESTGQFYVHRNCALWSYEVTRAENQALENVGPVVLKSSSQKCSFCNHYGASLVCRTTGCTKIFHFPCATASGAFQDLAGLNVFCSSHLGEAAMCSEAAICYTCKSVGDIANLMYCSSCGTHYHGSCVGLAQLPGVRAGWQCRKCRICQVCRVVGDETKLMSCEQCDKVYHASCQRPIVTSIPKYGWKCRCCRVCGDCGSRTPGAGLSSRWHLHYTVCDSCYQQRNKGCCCPVCQRAYRSHGHREMVQCSSCRKFVHGTCDPDADLGSYQQKKELNPEYDYVCLVCKNSTQQQQSQLSGRPLMSKRPSTDDPGEMSVSQESLYDDMSEFDSAPSDAESFRAIGLGKGKPYASKIAKKKLSYSIALPGRPKGGGFGKGVSGKQGFMKRQRCVDFGRKRGSKAKIRGIFGVPGVGLSRPVPDGKNDEEPGVENRLVLCSAKDKFVLTQDVCVMCGALGIDQEGCLIACVQCGQCYHPYCLNIKVTKVILQKGWRCLDCTVCEGCGQRNDESRLILCDDCDVSYHTYCMDPPLDYVPHGNWKCKWCASCRTCGSTDPGFNSSWMNGCTECGPCASLITCPSCNDPYSEGDLIVQCVQCERWLHGACDLIKTEMDAEKCAEEGYTCVLCRPRDVPPPHLVPVPMALKPPTPTKSPEVRNHANFVIDGVCLSESGNSLIKSLSLEHQGTRKKRKKLQPVVHDKEAGIMATIESVVAGGSGGENSFEDTKIEMVDAKDEPQEIYKEGMIWTKEDGPPPEGFTVFTMESGISVLRRKRQRNLQKLGIGGFLVRMRGFKTGQENDDIDTLPGQNTPTLGESAMQLDDKPKKKPIRRKPKSKLAETFPPYLQEAFFGKDLMDLTDLKKEVESGSSDDEKVSNEHQAIKLTAEELLAVETAKQERHVLANHPPTRKGPLDHPIKAEKPTLVKDEEDGSGEDLKDVLALSTDLFDNDLVNSIINEGDELAKSGDLDALADDDGELAQTLGSSENSKDAKDELSDILDSNFSLESISNINSKDVEDIFKNVLTDESQESQLSQDAPVFPSMPCQSPANQPHNLPAAPLQLNHSTAIPQMHLPLNQGRPNPLPGVQHVSFPPSPYHSEYSNSPQFSPAFSEPPSPWVSINDGVDMEPMSGSAVGVPSTSNQRSSEKMKADESLGSGATISAVLYANMKHSEWKTEYPAWTDRYKQIIKKWRTLSQEEKAPYLQQARDNRSQLRMKKQQQSQTAKETPTSPVAAAKPQSGPSLSSNMVACAGPALVASQTAQQPSSVGAPSTEVCTTTQRSASAQSLTQASTCSAVSVPTPVIPPRSSTPPPRSSPPTHQQFTVHGHFAGPGDRVGPAPNVTVNPNYQPNPCTDHAPLHPRPHSAAQQTNSSPSASDQQIRVLTPSEIMRTLPSLCQENYEPQQPDQEKMAQQQKTAREAEQERQWKQLQAMRQHQAQQQQHVIQEQRVQAIARVQRTISDPQQQFHAQTSPLQVATAPPETSPAVSPRQFIGIKSPPFAHPSPPSTNIRTPTPSQSPVHEFQQPKPQTPDQENFPSDMSGPANTSYPGGKCTPGPEAFTQTAQVRPSFAPMRSTLPGRPEQPEITRQLRDLLQRQQQQQQQQQQHIKSFEPPQGKSAPRVWNPTETGSAESPTTPTGTGENNITFREPLPPPSARPRGPLTIGVRPTGNVRMQQDGRLQVLDARLKLMLQQQTRVAATGQQPLTPGVVRFPSTVGAPRPTTIEQYEQLLQRQQQLQSRNIALEQQHQQQQAPSSPSVRIPESPPTNVQPKTVTGISQQLPVIQQNQMANDQEIPDNVTAELEKLEQETGTMAELQGVSEILGGLGDDDDELLAEMGADFNILEYADPELEALAGEKTNILDLDLEDDHLKQEKKKEALLQQQRQQQQQRQNLAAAQRVQQAAPSNVNNRFEQTQEPPKPVHTPTTAPPIEEPNTQKQSPLEASSLIPPQSPMNSLPPPSSDNMARAETVQPPIMQAQPPVVNPPAPPPPPDNNNPVQPQQPPTVSSQPNLALTTQQIHQQLLHQVQQAAASGKPMPPGAKLQTTDGIVGIVLPNNNVQLQIPPNFHQRLLVQFQNQKFAMRVGRPAPRPAAPNVNAPPPQQVAPGQMVRPRMALPTVPPPPPPYPGPPPPYPGNVVTQQHQQQNIQQQQQPHQMGLRMGPGIHPVHAGVIHPLALQGFPMAPHFNRRPLLLEEQPLLLEDLLEQEKREQEKQNHGHPASRPDLNARQVEPESALLSDHDFERLKADVFNSGHVPETGPPPVTNPMGMVPQQQQWQPARQNPPAQPTTEITTRVQMFNANLLPAPQLPPENIITEQDKQTQIVYENWLNHQNNVLTQQLKYYETEVQKLRKSRKSLNSKQRQLRKSGNQLSEVDSNELQRISAEQAILQKHLESSRKQSRQHGMLIQEYRNKQQPQKPLMNAQLPSPLGPPGSSPIHHPTASHSPLLSPQQSPMAQHNSPMSSPGPMIAHSPGHGPVAALLQSPGGNVSPMQPSPRIGTPLSQEGSPGPIQSPSQVCPPPPTPRMTSPQHRRVVTSPVSYTGDIRNTVTQMRFVRPTVDQHALQRLRTQTPSPLQGFPQKGGAPSPLNSPPLNQMTLAQQQLLQKQLHQQALLHQQQNSEQDVNLLHSQRVTQLIQHRNLNRPQGVIQQSNLTPQQHQMLAKQQQLALQLQARHNQQQQQQQQPQQQQAPKSPLHTQQQTMSPHSMPSSPMPPKSPMVAFNTPGSPAARSNYQQPPSSPMMHQYQTPTSPMMIHSPHSMRRPPSSPAMPERPTSVENPGTPRTPYEVHMQENMHTAGGNPNNPLNPIPLPPPGFFYSKLGLRGGTPMWSGFGRGEKRVPTPPTSEDTTKKKESHISKVSILKKKTPVSRSNLVENTLSRSSPKLFASTSHQDLGDDGSSSSSSPMHQKRFSTDKPLQLQPEVVDFDDDNSTLLSSEVSLSSAAQPNDDEIEMTETLSQNDLGEVLASPLESDQISDDLLLFPGNMMVDMPSGLQYSDKDEMDEEYTNIVIRSPTTSDDEFIMQDQRSLKKYNILNITENSESPEQDNGTEPEDDENTQPFEESEVVIIDQSTKSPEEQISTKEDFEELIDEGSRKEKLKMVEPKPEKQTVYSFPPGQKSQVVVTRPSNLAKVSFIAATPILQNSKLSSEPQQLILTPTSKITTSNASSKLTSIILTHNAMRSNILSVQGSKLPSQGITIVSATNSQIASILPSKFTVPVISASAVRQLPNVKVIDKPSSSLSLSAPEGSLPKKIFDDDSVSPDNGSMDDEKKNVFEEKMKNELAASKLFAKNVVKPEGLIQRQKITILTDKRENVESQKEKVQILTQSTTKSSSPVIIHHAPPELKMTAQVIQEMQITATETLSTFDGSNEDKSVVISIPSPTPSQEQMLDNIALQALEENRRREFESFEDVLDMIENMQHTDSEVDSKQTKPKEVPVESKKQAMPQLSPLSQPADLTTNMANASQQLRTLLSTIQTTSTAHTSNVETLVKSGQKVVNVSSASSTVVASRVIQPPVIVPNIAKPKPQLTKPQEKPQEAPKKTSLTLTAMLQNQPAATPTTKPSADTITAASLLATPVSLSRTSFSPALAQAQPNAIIAAVTANTSGIATSTSSSSVISSSFRTSTNLLHTQLTKSRTKSLDDIKDLKSEESKVATSESDIVSSIKQELTSSKFSAITSTHQSLVNKGEDSQNVLLKKLLQNTACASTQSPPPTTTTSITVSAPSSTSNIIEQKATLSSLLPPVIKSEPQIVTTTAAQTQIRRSLIRETSFVSSPTVSIPPTSTNQQLHIDVKKCVQPMRDELLSPPTPRSSCSQDSSLQTPPLVIKKENNTNNGLVEVKKELLDETSQNSNISDQGVKMEVGQIKEEAESGEVTQDKILDKEELKKQKRRMYNQKRRQNQLLNKENSKPNKRPRKNSKLEEDYDSYIDTVLNQIRHLPPMVVSEPVLVRNYGVMPIFGSGDLSKIGTKAFDPRCGDLVGSYGNALVPDCADYYSTKPYGDEEPIPEKPPASTQRGFYDQEFPLIRFDSDDDKKFDVFSRDDTPDSVISCSSPECEAKDSSDRYLGLKLISDDEDEDVELQSRKSPLIPLIKPIAIRLKPAGLYLKESVIKAENKENVLKESEQEKMKPVSTPPTPTKETDNIKVTLTLTSSAAEDIVGVLRDLANILQIPPPTSYQIVDKTTSPSGQKLGMYRTKGKDGKEGAPIDIQSILNGAAKFCKHCDVVILNDLIRKKLSDLPFLAKDFELLSEGEELYFCSSACYMQFALMHRSPSIPEDKAAAIIDHLSQKDKQALRTQRQTLDGYETKANRAMIDNRQEEPRNHFGQFFGSAFKPGNRFGLKQGEQSKSHRNLTYKYWTPGCLQPVLKNKKPTDKEIMEILYQMGITVTPPKIPDDTRKCMFCQMIGDGVADGPARLLNFDVDKWVHLNCALWSDGVYETVNGALMNLENAVQQSLTTVCVHCSKFGATIRCFKTRCTSVYHLSCAVRDNCVFFKNKTVFCTAHVPKNEKDNELTTLSVGRRVYVNRDENRQVAAVMHHSDTNNLLRVGGLIFLNVGQLLPHQLQNFHTPNYIYPIGYKIIRFYWSMRHLNKRCRYVCSIHDNIGRPEFRVLVQEYNEEDVEFKEQTPRGAWLPILEKVAAIRRENHCLQMFPKFISGEDLFGLTEPAIVRVLESLPGIETLADYKIKYGRNPLLELPLAINPTGAARTEPRLRHQTHWKRPHTQRTTGSSSRPIFGPSSASPSTPTSFGESVCPYSKQFVHSKSSQYRKMKQEWRNNVFLARSKIQGLGLYAARDLEKHTMVIEYIGEVIRTELSECREKQYEAKNRGIYMFRLDDDRVVDATLSGGLARYINHSCNPNCVAETVEIDRDLKIIIFAKRRIQRGEELAYDYKFDIEDDQNKISCMCGAPNCRKWMN